ncbi:hypothetical protein IFT48_03950 [Pseudomonas fluorescens]|uniref:hypothetical protein n=1 Tax=Pseudomonas fluorescens TaxID=294 RepID=UPI001930D419|nr:hypothetical protein [Pseudomonas fluorescens]MBD8089124.1 hypothetical protein [Pseudomonas fluorescens]
MPRFDLYSHSTNPNPEQLIAVCEQFVAFVAEKKAPSAGHSDILREMMIEAKRASSTHPYDLLEAAENLAEQILGHYPDLMAVSAFLADHRQLTEKLPHEVEQVFLWASVREHPSLCTILAQTHALYKDGSDSVAIKKREMMLSHTMLMMVPRPTLWDEDDRLKYSPAAFIPIHGTSLDKQVLSFFERGHEGLEKLLNSLSVVDAESRMMITRKLCCHVYESTLADDDPVRELLKDQLDNLLDAKTRVARMFDSPMNGGDEDHTPLLIEHAFSLIDKLSSENQEVIFEQIREIMDVWMETPTAGYYSVFENPDVGIPYLVQIFHRAQACGFNPMVSLYKHAPGRVNSDQSVVQYLIEFGIEADREKMTCAGAMKEAILKSFDENWILSLGLAEKHLIKLSSLNADAKIIRNHLLKSTAGRDAVFGSDLGL